MNEDEVRERVETAIECAESLRKLAESWGISPAYLSDVRTGRRAPGDSILRHLGLKRVVVVTYEPSEAAKDWPRAVATANPSAPPPLHPRPLPP